MGRGMMCSIKPLHLLLDHFVSLMVKTVVRAVLMRPPGPAPGSPLSSVDVSRT
jgi:hypothetical protein